MFLRYRFNYKVIEVHTGSNESLPVLLKNKERSFHKFLGFIDIEEARASKQAKPVKMVSIEAYLNEPCGNAEFFPIGSLIQGCILNNGLYCVVEDGKPKIIEASPGHKND